MININSIKEAAVRLSDVAIITPLLFSSKLDERVGGKVFLKPECLQRTGSFKIRGAYNLMSQLSDQQASNGVVAWSSGNHAQGVAAAGKILNIKTTIVMPKDAPSEKIDNTRKLGGKIIFYDRYNEDREQIAKEIAREQGSELVPSYDHIDIIAGQGTVGLEIMRQHDVLGIVPDQILICCGGGGLSAGSSVAIKDHSPNTDIYLVEPADFDDTLRSFECGERLRNSNKARSICDALQTESPGKITFEINRKLATDVLTVTDEETKEAMRFAYSYLKLVVEPGGAVALAAVLSGKIDLKNKITTVVLSGGNVDTNLYTSIIDKSLSK